MNLLRCLKNAVRLNNLQIMNSTTQEIHPTQINDTGNTVSAEAVGTTNVRVWKGYQKVLFRIAFIWFITLSIPTGIEWYQRTLALDWLHPNYRDIYDIARFLPDVPFVVSSGKGLKSYNDWFALLGIAVIGGLVWTALDRKQKAYNDLYYWLRVIVRYRAGIGMVGFGMQKVFPVQMAYPPTGILHTALGDMTMQKLYWWVIGITPWYQVFTGFVELTAGLLLFHRKTTFFGAVLLVTALGCVNYVNIAYDGGVHVYSTYFVVMGLFLLVYYAKDIYNLQIRERYTVPQHYYPDLTAKGWRVTRIGLKSLNILIFIVLLVPLQYLNFVYDPYNQPSASGIPELRGYYHVNEFRLNNKLIPYSPLDSVRWQEAAFEKWSSLSFRVNTFIPVNLSERLSDPDVKRFVGNNGFGFNSGAPQRDIDRTYESLAANRRSFYYRADTVNHVLYLQDKSTDVNPEDSLRTTSKDPRNKIYAADWISKDAMKNIVGEVEAIPAAGRSTRRVRAYAKPGPKDNQRDHMVLKYTVIDGGNKVILSGLDDKSDSIYVVLVRVEKNYTLPASTLVAGKLTYKER
jgi:hypothetical protein